MNSYIDIQNNRQVLDYLVGKFRRIGWHVSPNVTSPIYWGTYPNQTARYFVVNYESRVFEWSYKDDNSRGDEDVYATMEDAAALVDFVERNGEVLRPAFFNISEKASKVFAEKKFNKEYYGHYYTYYDHSGSMEPEPSISYKNIAETVEHLKKLAAEMDTPIMVSHQKPSTKKDIIFMDSISSMDGKMEKLMKDKFDAVAFQQAMAKFMEKHPMKVNYDYNDYWINDGGKVNE